MNNTEQVLIVSLQVRMTHDALAKLMWHGVIAEEAELHCLHAAQLLMPQATAAKPNAGGSISHL